MAAAVFSPDEFDPPGIGLAAVQLGQSVVEHVEVAGSAAGGRRWPGLGVGEGGEGGNVFKSGLGGEWEIST